MPHADIAIHRYSKLPQTQALENALDAVFFEASGTKWFADEPIRAAFRERWLGLYLDQDPAFAYVAMTSAGRVAGYLVGSIDDPALAERFSDIAYFQAFKRLTRAYPAQLHVNLAPKFRGAGLGSELISKFLVDAKAAGAPGAHVVTSRGAGNRGFYYRNGFNILGDTGDGERDVLFLAREL